MRWIVTVFIVLFWFSTGAVRAESRVELELLTEPGIPVTGQHEWMRALQGLGISNLRIRTERPGDEPGITQRGSGVSASYQVVGKLTSRNMLRLPGAKSDFRASDISGIRSWLEKLKEGGPQGLSETPGAFGLTASQLVMVHDALAHPVTFSTQGQPAFDVMKRIAAGIPLGFSADSTAQRTMRGEHVVADQLQGLSSGTALAAVLRPLGLVLVPQKVAGGKIQLLISDVRNAPESWPIGWPPQEAPNKTLPELFGFLQVEIEDTPLLDALGAISGRLEAPILLDYNSMARQRIDPNQLRVSLPTEKTYYKRILQKLLVPQKLKSELRVDEAGKPFLWISTLLRS